MIEIFCLQHRSLLINGLTISDSYHFDVKCDLFSGINCIYYIAVHYTCIYRVIQFSDP